MTGSQPRHKWEKDVLKELIPKIISLRHEIHAWPDLSGHEQATANRLLEFLQPTQPEQIHIGIGGNGIAVIFSGRQTGPMTAFTCELDAVPIADRGSVAYRSRVPDAGHMCGHDGHMATLAGFGALLGWRQPERGKVMLLFRPQEETGRGGPKVVADLQKKGLKPDYVFGFHNLPGHPLGALLYRRKQFAWAATDFVVELIGRSAHGSQPGAGRSPAPALSQIIDHLENLPGRMGVDPECNASQAAFAQLGEADHGTTPGCARLRATLRSHSNQGLEELCRKVRSAVSQISKVHKLKMKSRLENWIPVTDNHEEAVDLLLSVADRAGIPVLELEQPLRGSDDFGVLTENYTGVYFGIGSGMDCGHLHGPDFDYPDAIMEPTLRLYWALVEQMHGFA